MNDKVVQRGKEVTSMKFSASDFLGFSDEEVVAAFMEEAFEVSALNPQELRSILTSESDKMRSLELAA